MRFERLEANIRDHPGYTLVWKAKQVIYLRTIKSDLLFRKFIMFAL